MKNLILLLILTVSFSAFAQPPKKTWKIIVKNTLSADENYTLVGRTLADNDFPIDKKDKEFYTIKTTTQEISKSLPGVYFLNFSIKEGSISITGQYNANMEITVGFSTAKSSLDKISNVGDRGSWPRQSFNRMNEFALKLGSDVQYIAN